MEIIIVQDLKVMDYWSILLKQFDMIYEVKETLTSLFIIKKDRASIHKEIKRVSVREIEMFRKGIYKNKSVLYENNRLSKYVAQKDVVV